MNYKNMLIALILAINVGISFGHSHPSCDRSGNESYRYYGSCAEAPTKEACEQHYFVLGSHDPGMAWQCGWGTEIAGGEWCGNITPCLYDHGIAHGKDSEWDYTEPLCEDHGRRDIGKCHAYTDKTIKCHTRFETDDELRGYICHKDLWGWCQTYVTETLEPYQKCRM